MTPYHVRVVNPKTSEERTLTVLADQAAAEASPCPQSFVQKIARSDIPAGFMPIGNGVRPVVKQ
jgi:hypothetical protein